MALVRVEQENRVRLREQQRRQRQNERMREKVKNEIILKVRNAGTGFAPYTRGV